MSRTVVITGASSGIGQACAKYFCDKKDKVFITGRRASLLNEIAKEIGATPVAFDATDTGMVAAALNELPETVDVLINNAGGNTDLSPNTATSINGYDDLPSQLFETEKSWRTNFETNLLTAVLITEGFSDRFAKNARIVTIGSIGGRTGGGGSYGAAKAALEAWTADIARKFGPRGITANVIAPGLIEDTEFFKGKLSDDRRKNLIEATFTKRAGKPSDVVAAIAFLASPDAGHITGQVLPVNGGAHLAR